MARRDRSEISKLSSKFRKGTITPTELTRLEELEEQERNQIDRAVAPKSIWDLDVARKCWQGDARHVEK